MQEPRRVHGLDSTAELDSHPRDFRGREPSARRDHLLERPAMNQLHPQSDVMLEALGAINRDDIGVSHPGEQPALLDD